jgi:hypothetical protein
MPGSGSYYLHSAVPALAVLAGGAVAAVLDLMQSEGRGALIAVAVLTQIVSLPPSVHPSHSVDAARLAAAYIAAQGRPRAAVLSSTPELQFYAGNPVAVIPYVGEHALLESLAEPNVSFVVVARGERPAGTEHIAQEWDDLLRRYFVLAPIDVPGLLIYQRAAPRT